MNSLYNFEDEDLRLRQLKVLLDSLKRETNGSYMRIERGIRVYEFVCVDGILIPYFFGGRFFRAYPDFEVKKKLYNREQTMLDQQMKLGDKGMLNWVFILLIVLVLSLLGVAFMGYGVWVKNSNIDMQVNTAGINCNNAMSSIVANYGNIVNDYLKEKQAENQILKKNEVDNTINSPVSISPTNK